MFVFGFLSLDLHYVQDQCKLIKVLYTENFLWHLFSLMMALYT